MVVKTVKGFLPAICIVVIFFVNVQGEEPWRSDFDVVCSQTTNAMSLSQDELKKLIDSCERLQTVIEKQEETVRKVFLKRLQMCKNLYIYVLEAKKNEVKK